MFKRSFEFLILNFKLTTLCFCFFGMNSFVPLRAEGLDFKTLSLIPLQDGGRVKPLDTFVRESVRFITGKEGYEGKAAMETVLDWVAKPAEWEVKEFILVENLDLRSLLGIPKDQKRVSPRFLYHHEGFMAYAKSSYAKQQKKMTLNPMEKEALSVFGRLQRFEDILSGDALAFIPVTDPQTGKWASLGELQRAYHRDGTRMPESARVVLFAFSGVLKGYVDRSPGDFGRACRNLTETLKPAGEVPEIQPGRLALETQLNAWKPFRIAWILHLTAALLMGLSFLFNPPRFFKPGFALFIAGVLAGAYGFTLRCLVAGRPPVSNMYESLIWVTFGMTFFALVFELIFKGRTFALAGSILAVVGFILADNVPTILDPSIQPIEPVLRSNFWLTIHVLTITLSYAAFLLSLGMGHACLFTHLRHGGDRGKIQQQTKMLYRVVQVGVVLLASGTILGGVWASYSWGRFWGWDPKETWALIALLGYVAILHGRLAGWLKELGFAIGVVLAFLGVLMAWYGVNFILGVGLHSYGFSSGGLPFVITFVVFETIFVTFVGLKAGKSKS